MSRTVDDDYKNYCIALIEEAFWVDMWREDIAPGPSSRTGYWPAYVNGFADRVGWLEDSHPRIKPVIRDRGSIKRSEQALELMAAALDKKGLDVITARHQYCMVYKRKYEPARRPFNGVAKLLGCSERTAHRRYKEAISDLTQVFLKLKHN